MSTTRSPTRSVVVDDTDSRIHYNGEWFQTHQFFEGSNGPAFENTLHVAQQSASLSFSFSGSAVIVWGSIELPDDNGLAVDCFIDNVSTGSSQSRVQSSQNNLAFCQQDSGGGLQDGLHILTVNATITGKQMFRFDYINYVPSASVPLDREIIRVDHSDTRLQYGQGWDTLLGTTSVEGSVLNFDFTGVSISWYGGIANGNSSQATYSIDGQTPIKFDLTANPSTETDGEKLFQTTQLPAGPHTMKVVYQGNNSSVPLELDYLIIQNGTLSSTTTSSVPSHATAATSAIFTTSAATATASHNATTSIAASSASNPEKSSVPVGAIVGGTIGGLALIVLAIFMLLYLRRRQKRVSVEEDEVYNHAPSLLEFPTPYTLTKVPPQTSPLSVVSSSPSPSLLPSRTKREPQAPESLATVEFQRHSGSPPTLISVQSNATSSQGVLFHEDSGIRMPQSPSTASAVIEIPPSYSVV